MNLQMNPYSYADRQEAGGWDTKDLSDRKNQTTAKEKFYYELGRSHGMREMLAIQDHDCHASAEDGCVVCNKKGE